MKTRICKVSKERAIQIAANHKLRLTRDRREVHRQRTAGSSSPTEAEGRILNHPDHDTTQLGAEQRARPGEPLRDDAQKDAIAHRHPHKRGAYRERRIAPGNTIPNYGARRTSGFKMRMRHRFPLKNRRIDYSILFSFVGQWVAALSPFSVLTACFKSYGRPHYAKISEANIGREMKRAFYSFR